MNGIAAGAYKPPPAGGAGAEKSKEFGIVSWVPTKPVAVPPFTEISVSVFAKLAVPFVNVTTPPVNQKSAFATVCPEAREQEMFKLFATLGVLAAVFGMVIVVDEVVTVQDSPCGVKFTVIAAA